MSVNVKTRKHSSAVAGIYRYCGTKVVVRKTNSIEVYECSPGCEPFLIVPAVSTCVAFCSFGEDQFLNVDWNGTISIMSNFETTWSTRLTHLQVTCITSREKIAYIASAQAILAIDPASGKIDCVLLRGSYVSSMDFFEAAGVGFLAAVRVPRSKDACALLSLYRLSDFSEKVLTLPFLIRHSTPIKAVPSHPILLMSCGSSIIVIGFNQTLNATYKTYLAPVGHRSPEICAEAISDIQIFENSGSFYVALSSQEVIQCSLDLKSLTVQFGQRRSVGRSINSLLCFDQYLVALSYTDGLHFMDKSTLEFSESNSMSAKCLLPQIFLAEQNLADSDYLVAVGRNPFASICRFADDMPFSIEVRSDQLFRGCTGLWLLREFSSDEGQSTVVVSFINNTVVFKLTPANSVFLEESSEFYGIETNERTLAIRNAESASLLIQVCIDRVRLCKSNRSDISGSSLVDWRGSSSATGKLIFFAAQICKDFVFGLDSLHSNLYILHCRATRNAASISTLTIVSVPEGSCALDVVPLDPKQPENLRPHSPPHTRSFVIAIASNNLETAVSIIEIFLFDALEASCRVEKAGSVTFENFTINQIKLLEEGTGIYRLVVGGRNGSVLIRSFFVVQSESINMTSEQGHLSVGSRPVQLQMAPVGLSILSGSAHILKKDGKNKYGLEALAPRADHIVWWSRNLNGRKTFHCFIVEHESLAVGVSPLICQPRFDHLISVPNLRHVVLKANLNLLIAAGSSPESDSSPPSSSSFIEAYAIQGDELICRTMFSVGDTITCLSSAGDTDFVMIGLQVEHVGQLRVLHIPSEKYQSRRSSMITKAVPPFILGVDVGFPHKVNGCEFLGKLGSESHYYALVAAGNDLHVLEIDIAAEKINFLLTESWRAEILTIAVNRVLGNIFAIVTSRGGLEIYEMSLTGELRVDLRQLWSDTSSALFDRILWCDKNILTATDRRGFVHVFKFSAHTNLSKGMIEIGDIPVSITRHESGKALLVSTVTGAVLELPIEAIIC